MARSFNPFRTRETVDIRVVAADGQFSSPSNLLAVQLPTVSGEMISLSELVDAERTPALATIRHYNFRRTITVEADINPELIDTVSANRSDGCWTQFNHLTRT